jgi:hypothetical protein
MTGELLAELLRTRAQALERQAGPVRGPRAPQRPGGPDASEVTSQILLLMAGEYRELADLVETAAAEGQ